MLSNSGRSITAPMAALWDNNHKMLFVKLLYIKIYHDKSIKEFFMPTVTWKLPLLFLENFQLLENSANSILNQVNNNFCDFTRRRYETINHTSYE